MKPAVERGFPAAASSASGANAADSDGSIRLAGGGIGAVCCIERGLSIRKRRRCRVCEHENTHAKRSERKTKREKERLARSFGSLFPTKKIEISEEFFPSERLCHFFSLPFGGGGGIFFFFHRFFSHSFLHLHGSDAPKTRERRSHRFSSCSGQRNGKRETEEMERDDDETSERPFLMVLPFFFVGKKREKLDDLD